MPISLSDHGMIMVWDACRPLLPPDRDAFMAALGRYFHGRSEVDDGEPNRAIKELQREFWEPPQFTDRYEARWNRDPSGSRRVKPIGRGSKENRQLDTNRSQT